MIVGSTKLGQGLDVRSEKNLRGLILRVLIEGNQNHVGPVMLLVMISRVLFDDFFTLQA